MPDALLLNEKGGAKFTWTVRLADRSGGQMLRERGKPDSQLAKMGGADQDVATQFPHLIPVSVSQNLFQIFMTTKFYPSHCKIKDTVFDKILYRKSFQHSYLQLLWEVVVDRVSARRRIQLIRFSKFMRDTLSSVLHVL